MLKKRTLARPRLSVALTLKLNRPRANGVPLIVPPDERVRPSGMYWKGCSVQVTAPEAPVTVSDKGPYAVPTLPVAKVELPVTDSVVTRSVNWRMAKFAGLVPSSTLTVNV